MLLKTDLPLSAATTIVDRALAAARAAGMAPLTVAVLDAGPSGGAQARGRLRHPPSRDRHRQGLGRARHGGVEPRPRRPPARGAGVPERARRRLGRTLRHRGGVLICDGTGAVIGAVGISGDRSEKDEYCAIEGIHAAGLVSDPAEPDPAWQS